MRIYGAMVPLEGCLARLRGGGTFHNHSKTHSDLSQATLCSGKWRFVNRSGALLRSKKGPGFQECFFSYFCHSSKSSVRFFPKKGNHHQFLISQLNEFVFLGYPADITDLVRPKKDIGRPKKDPVRPKDIGRPMKDLVHPFPHPKDPLRI